MLWKRQDTKVLKDNKTFQFDALWFSDSYNGLMDDGFEISVNKNIENIVSITTKPIIYDLSACSSNDEVLHKIKALDKLGVSMVVIEDDERSSTNNVCDQLSSAKRSNSMILGVKIRLDQKEVGAMLDRAAHFVEAGADAIMISGSQENLSAILDFAGKLRKNNSKTLIAVDTADLESFSESQLQEKGINLTVYSNQLTRCGFMSMRSIAEKILTDCGSDQMLNSINDIKKILK